jgi:hypothetical protein
MTASFTESVVDEAALAWLEGAGWSVMHRLEVASIHAYISEARSGLIENGVLRLDGKHYVFTQDYPFASPSTAAGALLGRSANGRIEWKTKDGRTLKVIQEVEVAC